MLQYEYSRSALKLGLAHEAKLGTIRTSSARSARRTATPAWQPRMMTTSSASTRVRNRARRMEHAFAKFGDLAISIGKRWPPVSSPSGQGEHAHVPIRRDAAEGSIRNDRAAHDCALLRRLGLQQRGSEGPATGQSWLRERRAHGRRPEEGARRKVGHFPDRCTEGSHWRQSRPHPGRQGLDGRERRAAREGV